MKSNSIPGLEKQGDSRDELEDEGDIGQALLDDVENLQINHEAVRLPYQKLDCSSSDFPITSGSSKSSQSVASYLWIFKSPNFNLFSKIALKWTGNIKEIVKLSFIFSQIFLIMFLYNKNCILKLKIAAMQHQAHKMKIETRSDASEVDNYNFSTSQEERTPEIKFTVPWHSTPPSTALPKACYFVEVSTQAEFEKQLQQIVEGTDVCLNINSERSSNWSMQNFSNEINMVKEIVLKGCFHISFLSEILEKFIHAYKVTFGEPNNIFCERSSQFNALYKTEFIHKPKIYLLNLTEVVFENTNCTRIFEFLSKRFYMNGVTSLTIKSMDIEESNIFGIRQLLQQFKYSLQILHFSEVVWKVDLFEKFSYEVPNLLELQMDFLSQNDRNITFLRGFNTAENLLRIKSLKGFLPFDQFSVVTDFKMMEILVLGVEISDEVNTLDTLFPVDSLPKLKSMELFLKFSNISKCYLLSEYNIKRSYKIRLHSNCDVDF